MRKLWEKIMNNKLLTLSILFFLATVIFAPGCATVATLTSPTKQTGPTRGRKRWRCFGKPRTVRKYIILGNHPLGGKGFWVFSPVSLPTVPGA
ncbi:hypothetical protein LCGC14_1252600, partial [marine sediment metagenome]